jgi:hypothetical protein
MASRYWVGGTGTWSAASTTNWSATSGGAAGASVPGAADDVIFDSASNVAGSGASYTVTRTATASITSITMANPSAGIVTLTLSAALTTTAAITVTSGIFNTGGFAVSATQISSNNSNIRSINLGASAVTLSAITPVEFTTSTNLTFSGGTSTITCSNTASAIFLGAGFTYYNVTFAAKSISLRGTNTFNNLTFPTPVSGAPVVVSLTNNIIVNGTLTSTSANTDATARTMFWSSTIGATRTITAAAVSLIDVDFIDVVGAGAAIPFTGTRIAAQSWAPLTVALNITPSTPKTVYRVGTDTTWAGSSSWALTSGGTGSNLNYPLMQDTAVIDNTTAAASITPEQFFSGVGPANIGSVDMSTRSTAFTFNFTNGANIFGDFKNGSGTTISGTGIAVFASNGSTQNILSSGKTFTAPIYLNGSGTFKLSDAFISSATIATGNPSFSQYSGTLNLNNFNMTIPYQFASYGTSPAGSTARTVAFGTGSMLLTNATAMTVWNVTDTTGFTATGTGGINLTGATTAGNTRTISHGSSTGPTEAGAINVAISAGAGDIALEGYIRDLNCTGLTGTIAPWSGSIRYIYGSLTIPAVSTGMRYAGDTTFASTSTGKTITINDQSIVGNIVFNGVGGGWTLGSNFGSITSFTLTAGAFNLNNFTMTVGNTVTSTGTGVRSIAFGTTGAITVTGSSAIWNMADLTNFTTTGTSTVNISNNSAAAATIVYGTTGGTETNSLNFNITIGTYTLTVTSGSVFKNLNFTGFTGTCNFTSTIYGNLTMVAGMTSTTSAVTMAATSTGKTINTAGKVLASLVFNGVGGGWTAAAAITTTGAITLTAGAFDTAGFSLLATAFNSSNTNTRSLTLGASNAVNLSLGWDTTISTNMTLTPSTSVITIAATAPYFYGGSLTYYSVILSSTAITNGYVTGSNTYTLLEFGARAAAGLSDISIGGNQTVTGTFKLNNGNANARTFIHSDVIGTQRTFNVVTHTTGSDTDFRNIAATGTSAPWDYTVGKRGGNCLGNSGITFDAAKNVYWNLTGTQNWSATAWATTSAGTPAAANFPLAQDTAIFDNAGAATTVTLDANYNIGTINFSARTTAVTFATGTTNPIIYGSLIYTATRPTVSGTGILTFAGQGVTQTINTNANSLTQSLNFDTFNGTVTLGSALTQSNVLGITLTSGNFNTGTNYALIASSFFSSNTNTRSLSLGSSAVTIGYINANIIWDITTSTGMTLTPGTSTISFASGTPSAGGVANFYGGGLTYNNVTFTSSNSAYISNIAITGGNTFNTLTFAGTNLYDSINKIRLYNNQISNNLTMGNVGDWRRWMMLSDTIGTARSITGLNGTVSLLGVDFRDITLSGTAAGLTTGTSIGDCGGNSGFTVTPAATKYFSSASGGVLKNGTWSSDLAGTISTTSPLPQDTAKIASNVTAGSSIDVDFTSSTDNCINLPIIDFSARATALTFNCARSSLSHGNITLSSSITPSGSGILTLSKRGTQTITSAGRTLTMPVVVDTAPTSDVQLADALTISNTLTVTRGTFDAVASNVSATTFTSSNSNTRSVKIGSGSWTLTGTGTVWDITNPVNMTFDKNTGSIILSDTSATARAFYSNGIRYGTVVIGGTTGSSTTTFYGTLNTFDDMTTTKTVAYTVTFEAGKISQFKKFSLTGASGLLLTLNSSTVGTRHTLKKFTPWLVGVNSTLSNCTGLSLTTGTPAINYIAFTDIAGTVAGQQSGNMSFLF